MTSGVLQAVQLRDTTVGRLRNAAAGAHADAKRAALQGLSSEFHAKLPSVLDFPWTVATGDAPCSCSRGTLCTSQAARQPGSQPTMQLHLRKHLRQVTFCLTNVTR